MTGSHPQRKPHPADSTPPSQSGYRPRNTVPSSCEALLRRSKLLLAPATNGAIPVTVTALSQLHSPVSTCGMRRSLPRLVGSSVRNVSCREDGHEAGSGRSTDTWLLGADPHIRVRGWLYTRGPQTPVAPKNGYSPTSPLPDGHSSPATASHCALHTPIARPIETDTPRFSSEGFSLEFAISYLNML